MDRKNDFLSNGHNGSKRRFLISEKIVPEKSPLKPTWAPIQKELFVEF